MLWAYLFLINNIQIHDITLNATTNWTERHLYDYTEYNKSYGSLCVTAPRGVGEPKRRKAIT